MSAHAPPRHLTQGLLVNEAGVDTDAFVDYADITRRKADSDGLIDNAGGTAGGGASVAPGGCPAWCPSCCHNKCCTMLPRVFRFMPALGITINSSLLFNDCPAFPGLSAILLAWGCVLILISTLNLACMIEMDPWNWRRDALHVLFAVLLFCQALIAIPMATISWLADVDDDSGGCNPRILWPSRIGTVASSLLVVVLFTRLAYAAKYGRGICRLGGEAAQAKGPLGSRGGLANGATFV